MAGTVLEQLAYGVARGCVRAWFDELDARAEALREVADLPADSDRAARFRAAVERQRLRLSSARDPGPERPASGGG